MLGWLFRRAVPRPPVHAATVRELLPLARYEAVSRGQEFVGTQHLLLALARLADRPAGRALAAAEGPLRAALAEHLEPGLGEVPAGELPFTPTVRRVLKSAEAGARACGAECAEPEQLLLALLTDPEGSALATLTGMGVDLERLGRSLAGIAPDA